MGVPGWFGPVGSTLVDAATGFSDALLDIPDIETAREKRRLENERLKSQVDLDRARAAYEARRGTPGYQSKRIVKDKLGNVWQIDMDTESTSLLVEAPAAVPKALKPEEQLQEAVFGAISRKLGKPPEQWSDEDLLRPDIRPLIDLVYKQPDIVAVPGAVPTTREVIRGRIRRRQEGAQVTDEGTPAASTPPSPTTPKVPTTAPKVPPATSGPTTGSTSGTTSGRGTRDLLPMVAGYEREYETLSDSDLQSALDKLSIAQTDHPSPVIEAQLMAIGRIMAKRSRAGRRTTLPGEPPADPRYVLTYANAMRSITPQGALQLVSQLTQQDPTSPLSRAATHALGEVSGETGGPPEPAPLPLVATYADAMRAITPRGAHQMVSQLQRRSPDSLVTRAATEAFDQVYGPTPRPDAAGAFVPPQGDALAELAQQPGFPETTVQPAVDPWSRPTDVVRVAARSGAAEDDIDVLPPRPSTPDDVRRLARELFGAGVQVDKLTQDQQQQLNRELARRGAQGKQRYEDELNNTRAVQDVRPTDFDRFFYRGSGQPVPGTLPYGLVKALQQDKDAASGVVHLTTDGAKQLTTLKLLEPVLKQYAELIEYAYGPGGPLADYTREPLPILGAMVNQFAQTNPTLQAKRRAIEGQLQSLVRALGSRGDLNAQELEQATNLIANMDASVGLGFTGGLGVGLGRGGVGPMIGFRPTISIPDSPRVGVQLANELITQVNARLGTLLQNPDYAGTPRLTVPASRRTSLFGMPSAEKLEERVREDLADRFRQ